jgi:imidazoleglycerol-phosphate dehydratase
MKANKRQTALKRKTKETQIEIRLNLDGSGRSQIQTEIPFLSHMLDLLTKHGNFDLKLKATGDTEIDIHHLNEDIGIALGAAFKKALGSKIGIQRYGFFYLPMDRSLARVVLDISGRPSFVFQLAKGERILKSPSYQLHDALHFLESLSFHLGLTLQVDVLRGGDFHHCIEAIFKAFARALSMAVSINPRAPKSLPSTKGLL